MEHDMIRRDDNEMLSRAQGCLVGDLVGDALGSRVEFKSEYDIAVEFPGRLTEIVEGGDWNTIAGQPTDDGEMAIALARSIVAKGAYRTDSAFKAYVAWFDSGPFDYGETTRRALKTHDPSLTSQANGALMRSCPLGIFGALADPTLVRDWAHLDAKLTHPNPVCTQVNELFVRAIAKAIRFEIGPQETYEFILEWAREDGAIPSVLECVKRSLEEPPAEYFHRMGWVLIAFGNALYQMMHTDSFEEALIDTVNRGGDTDTNGAIVGALFGAIYGFEAIPERWSEKVLNCRPDANNPLVKHPRPREYWPIDALELARELLSAGYAWKPRG